MRIYLRLLIYLKPYRMRIVFSVVCMLLFAVSNGALAYLLGPSITMLFATEESYTFTVLTFDIVLSKDELLVYIPIAIVLTSLVNGLASYGNIIGMSYASNMMVADLRNKLYEHILKLPIGFFTRTSTGNIVSMLTHNINFLSKVSSDVVAVPKELMSVIVLLGMLVVMDWKLFLVAFFAFPLALYPSVKLSKIMKNMAEEGMSSMGLINSLVFQAVSGIRVVKSFCKEGFEVKEFKKASGEYTEKLINVTRIKGIAPGFTQIIGSIGFATTIWYASYRINSGDLKPEAFMSFFAALLLLYRSAKPLSGIRFNLQQGIAAANSVFNVLDLDDETISNKGTKLLKGLGESVEFRDVCFGYRNKDVLNDINLVVQKGSRVALVGSSGAGKTTLVNLLPRFYEVNEGTILIDSVDINEFTLDSLRSQISIVSQEVVLFDDTIKNNIAYGDDSKTLEDVVSAAKQANAHDFISKLPKGYDSIIGESGFNLSGGERQRLSIARALLKNAPMLILDEATSSLDSESEQKIQIALDNLMKDRTTFVIAHRLSTVRDADMIVVLSEGKIIETGKHDELIANKSNYSRLYSTYLAGK